MKKHLIAYAKRPLPGYAKTRLGNEIGFDQAAGVYARLLYNCLFNLTALVDSGICLELSLASDADVPFFGLAFPEFQISTQSGTDLGQRFSHSFRNAFQTGAEAVVVVGTDIPDLDVPIIRSAFRALADHDVVIGPDRDGGYYLIGTRRSNALLFQDIDWSSPRVFEQTRLLLDSQALSVYPLPVLADVDTAADFQRWREGSITLSGAQSPSHWG